MNQSFFRADFKLTGGEPPNSFQRSLDHEKVHSDDGSSIIGFSGDSRNGRRQGDG
jgi:hypothetical protein